METLGYAADPQWFACLRHRLVFLPFTTTSLVITELDSLTMEEVRVQAEGEVSHRVHISDVRGLCREPDMQNTD